MPSNKSRKQNSSARKRRNPSGGGKGGGNRSTQIIERKTFVREINPTFTCMRSARLISVINPYSGFLAIGFDLTFDFSLSQIRVFQNLVNITSISVPGSVDISNFFDQWRLDSVEVMILYTNNTSQVAGVALPLIYTVFDPSAYFETVSAPSYSNMIQSSNLKFHQLGATDNVERVYTIQPRAEAAGALMMDADRWVDTSIPTFPHLALSCFYDNMGNPSATTTTIGNVEFIFRMKISARVTA